MFLPVYATNLEEVSFITSDSSFVKPAGTGTDKVAVSDLEEFAGERTCEKPPRLPRTAQVQRRKWPGRENHLQVQRGSLKNVEGGGVYENHRSPLRGR